MPCSISGHTANLAKMALISFEDLAELDDEQLDDEVPENSQPADEEEEERLLAHWQAVGRTHQVTVPRGTVSECRVLFSVDELVPCSFVQQAVRLSVIF